MIVREGAAELTPDAAIDRIDVFSAKSTAGGSVDCVVAPTVHAQPTRYPPWVDDTLLRACDRMWQHMDLASVLAVGDNGTGQIMEWPC